jgi:hypothetical protein
MREMIFMGSVIVVIGYSSVLDSEKEVKQEKRLRAMAIAAFCKSF